MSFSPLPPPCPILHRAHAPIFSSSQIHITLFLQHYTIYTCLPPKEFRQIIRNILILHIKAVAIIGQGGAIVSCITTSFATYRSQYRIGGVIGYGWLVVFLRIRLDECKYLHIDLVSSHAIPLFVCLLAERPPSLKRSAVKSKSELCRR